MPGCFALQVLDDIFDSGDLHFDRTGVDIGATGIAGLLQQIHLLQHGWQKEDAGGSQSIAASDFDTSLKMAYTRFLPEVLVAGAGTHKLRQTFILPEDFGSFPDNALSVMTYRSGSATAMTLNMYVNGAVDATITAFDVKPAGAAAWTVFTVKPGSAYVKGDMVTLEFVYESGTVGNTAAIGDLELIYKTGQGNV